MVLCQVCLNLPMGQKQPCPGGLGILDYLGNNLDLIPIPRPYVYHGNHLNPNHLNEMVLSHGFELDGRHCIVVLEQDTFILA